MLAHDYLSLRLTRLRNPEQWTSKGEGLAFILADSGKGKQIAPAITHQFGPGDVLVYSRKQGPVLRALDNEEVVFWCFSAHLEHLFPLFAEDEIFLLQDLEDRFKIPRFYPAAGSIASQCHQLLASVPPQFNLDHRSHLLRVAAVVLSAELSEAHQQKHGFVRIEEHLNQVFEKISIEDLLGLSVTELACRFGCTRRHLTRLFHHHFGCSVASLRMEMRLLKAASLFRDPDAKVINVAEQCGFNHLGLFNTCFKRRFGVSPGQWRKHPPAGNPATKPVMGPDPRCRLRASGLCPWTVDGHANKHVLVKLSMSPGVVRSSGSKATNPGKPAKPTGRIHLNP